MSKPILQVIVGSTRPGRVGRSVADWFVAQANEHGEFDVEVIDLAHIGLPMTDEPHHPRLRTYVNDHTKRWSETIDRADAYVFVIPEYNYSLSAAVKNAIDFLYQEWAYKPLGIVSYGGVSGGLRAAGTLKQVASALKMIPTPDLVTIPMVAQLKGEDGNFNALPVMDDSAAVLLKELHVLHNALTPLREAQKIAQ